jgi:hypothetical protein
MDVGSPGGKEMMLFLRILMYVILIPTSLVYPMRFLDHIFEACEYKFIPFRWREENFDLILLPFLWLIPWAAFWIWFFVK